MPPVQPKVIHSRVDITDTLDYKLSGASLF